MKRVVLALAAAAMLIAAEEPRYQSSPERHTVVETRDWGPWGGPFRERLIPSLMRDFGERYLYADANAKLPPPAHNEQRVVFLGDSITDGWDLGKAFPGKPYVNRGIGAQVTAQMLLRFQQDVVALRPAAVVILGGTNDVSGFFQVETPETILANITAMADIADSRGIRVVLCALLPVNDYGENRGYMTKERPPATLRAVNDALRKLATARSYAFADYAAPLADTRGMLTNAYTGDGLHPNAAGYARMAPVVHAAIAEVLAKAPRKLH
jgi:lysophospholipase L1-like esterase